MNRLERQYGSSCAGLSRSLVRSLLILLLAGAVPAAAEEVQVTLRPPLGYVGEEVRVPIYVEGARAKSLRRLSLDVRFPGKLLSFEGVEPGFLLRGPEISLESRTSAEGDESVVTLALSTERGVPEGLILYLRLRLADTAPLGGEVPLTTRGEGTWVDVDGGLAKADVAFPGEVLKISPRRKEDEFIFACFFYMH